MHQNQSVQMPLGFRVSKRIQKHTSQRVPDWIEFQLQRKGLFTTVRQMQPKCGCCGQLAGKPYCWPDWMLLLLVLGTFPKLSELANVMFYQILTCFFQVFERPEPGSSPKSKKHIKVHILCSDWLRSTITSTALRLLLLWTACRKAERLTSLHVACPQHISKLKLPALFTKSCPLSKANVHHHKKSFCTTMNGLREMEGKDIWNIHTQFNCKPCQQIESLICSRNWHRSTITSTALRLLLLLWTACRKAERLTSLHVACPQHISKLKLPALFTKSCPLSKANVHHHKKNASAQPWTD